MGWDLGTHLVIYALHNVHIVDFVFLPTEQAVTYLKICILTYSIAPVSATRGYIMGEIGDLEFGIHKN